MEFRITMGVRQGDDLWKRQLNDIVRKRQADIDGVLLSYGVPLLDEDEQVDHRAARVRSRAAAAPAVAARAGR